MRSARAYVRPVPVVLGALVTVVAGLVIATPVQATTPGTDGEIAYVRRVSGSRSELFAMNSDGSEKGNVSRTKRIAESTPAWSPKGGLLAFQAVKNHRRRIRTLNMSTGVARRVSSGPFADRFPAWSPDGKNLAYRSLRRRPGEGDLGSADIYVVPRTGGSPTKLTSLDGINTDPAWSPDGTRIAFASNSDGNYDIYVMDADGSDVIQLTNDGVGPPAVINRYPNWSPDGTKIAYVSTRNHNEDIYVMDVSGGFGLDPPTVQLTDDPGIDRSPVWSPSGSKIAFASKRGGRFNIWTMSAADGSGLTQLTSGEGNNTEPTWQPLVGCTIVGTDGDDVLVGTPGHDVICALGGDDTIHGRGGNDVIYGGPGNDAIDGGRGGDAIDGGRGRDEISGGNGRDRLFGGDGRDTISARDHRRDRVDGGRGRDGARVDPGLDRLRRIEVLF